MISVRTRKDVSLESSEFFVSLFDWELSNLIERIFKKMLVLGKNFWSYRFQMNIQSTLYKRDADVVE